MSNCLIIWRYFSKLQDYLRGTTESLFGYCLNYLIFYSNKLIR